MAVSSFRGLASLRFSGGDLLLSSSHGDRTKKKKKTSYLVSSSVERSLQKTEKELRLKSQVDTLLDSMKWDEKGLAVAIAQNVDTGAVLMQGFANRDALATTISTQKATFYSRSRSSLWTKGETSSNFINVHDIFLDCDRDSILYLGKPDGPTCHTGSDTCYFSSVFDVSKHPQVKENNLALTTLFSLESTVLQRKAEIGATKIGKPSWTKRLLLDEKLLCSKIREEANELCQTLEEKEDSSRTASEMADVLYHAMVLLAVKDVKIEGVLEVLRKRFLEEKNNCNLISVSIERSLEKTVKELHSELEVKALIDGMKWDDKGLVVAIAQNVDTGAILMQGFANRDALAMTISSRKATFYSRSRSTLWTKGETSKNFINMQNVLLDCDCDSVLYIGKPDGPTCHTGLDTCYFSSVSNLLKHPQVKGSQLALTTLYSLEAMVCQHKAQIGTTQNGAPSWAKLLLDKKLLCSNIREKANKLCLTLEGNEDGSCTASEMANVLYHAMILLAVKDVKIEEVLEVLRIRFSQSGIEEKDSRKSGSGS